MSTTSHRIGSTVRWSVYQKSVVAISRTRNFECFDNYASNLHSDVDLIEAATKQGFLDEEGDDEVPTRLERGDKKRKRGATAIPS